MWLLLYVRGYLDFLTEKSVWLPVENLDFVTEHVRKVLVSSVGYVLAKKRNYQKFTKERRSWRRLYPGRRMHSLGH
jgi:hypothetical protein